MNPSQSCILTYHSIDRSGSVISVTPEMFREHMANLAGRRIVRLQDVQAVPGSVALTFDDGFRNFFEHALPVLQEFGYPATVFLVSGYIGGRNDWPTQPSQPYIPTLDLMSWSDVEQIVRLRIDLGAHTITHPYLSRLAIEGIEREMADGKARLEDRAGRKIDAFAYPYGDINGSARAAAERHFTIACGTRLAFVSGGSDPLNLPRIDAFYLRRRFWFERLSTSTGHAYLALRASLRHLRRGQARMSVPMNQ
jgi:peptidoglycan/xylan/chitin deacetylase (PgdA/CDA1 family)